jgi:hypothetical protein
MADAILFHHRTTMVRRLRLAPGEATPWHRGPFHEPQDILVQQCVQRVRIPMKKLNYDRITTTIEREWLAEIIAGTKKIEYRKVKPYWTKRFAKVSVPFELRLLNGMNPPLPEVTVLIHRITKDRRAGEYRLHIKKVLGFKHWDKRRQKPRR